MSKHRWLELTEGALLLGSGAGTIASVATQQVLLAAAPLSLLAGLGMISRQRLQTRLTQSQSVTLSLNKTLDQRLQTLQTQLKELPTHQHLRAVRQSVVAQNNQDILSLSQVLEYTRKSLTSQIEALEVPDLREQRQSLVHLQELYTRLCIDLKDVKARCQQLSNTSRIEATETTLTKLKAELMQMRVHLDVLGADTKNNYAGLNDKIHYLQQKVQQLATEEHQSLLREEVQELVKTVLYMVSRDEFLELSRRLDNNVEQLQQRIQLTSQQLRAQTAPAAADSMANTQWLLDFTNANTRSPSRQALEQLITQARERLILVWPWTDDVAIDEPLLQLFRQLLERHCRLDIGWCHQGDNRESRLLHRINQRWNESNVQRQQLKQALSQLLPLKQEYPTLFSFKILGTTENFAVADASCAVIGLQSLATQTSLFPTVKPKVQVTEPEIIQPLIQRFEEPTIDADDADAYFNRGITRYDMRDYLGAIDDLTQVVCIRPSAAAYNCRGVAWAAVNDSAMALQDFGHAIRLDSHLFAARCNRGVLRIGVHDYAGALNDLETAVELYPKSAIPYFYQGQIFQALGNVGQAIRNFGLAIERQPDVPLPYCYRGAVYQKQGNVRQAVADLEVAAHLLRVHGDVNNLNQVMRKLELLRQPSRVRTTVTV